MYCTSFPKRSLLSVLSRLGLPLLLAVIGVLALNLALITPRQTALAHEVAVDGEDADWVMSATNQVNLGHIGRDTAEQGEYVWLDNPGDQRTVFSDTVQEDLTEFRVTADRDYLYFTAAMSDVITATGDSAPQIRVAIDTDRATGSGTQSLGNSTETSTTVTATWEYLLVTPFGSASSTTSETILYQGGLGTSILTGTAAIDMGNEVIEFSVPWTALGMSEPPTLPLRFTVASFRAQADDATLDDATGSDALDALTNCGDPGDTSNTSVEVGDGVVDYAFDLFFEPDGDVSPPLLVSEVYYDATSADSDNEWLEIYNTAPISISLNGIKIGDEETPDGSEAMAQLPSGYSIAPGAAVIVALRTTDGGTDGFENLYGFKPDFETVGTDAGVPDTSSYSNWASSDSFALANSGDEVLLLDGSDTVLDVVVYEANTWPGVSGSIAAATGQSIERAPANWDTNDIALDFIVQPNDGTPSWAVLRAARLQPPRNAVTAMLDTTISASFGDPISPTTVSSVTFAVHGMQSGLVTETHAVNGSTMIVTPSNPFHPGELVYAIATTHTRNYSGQQVAAASQWQFNAGVVNDRCIAGFVTDTVASQNLIGVFGSSVAWGDYDNDGDLDALLTGDDGGGARYALVYENQDGVLVTDTVASQNLIGVAYSSVAWGDYDNDGDLDILLTGLDSGNGFNAFVYENQAGLFVTDTVASQNLTGVYYSSAAWGDYDNDGDLDILLTGTSGGFNGIAEVYENTDAGFNFDAIASANLVGVYAGSVAWGDYDNDGDLDILLTGAYSSAVRHALIYENQAGVLVTDTVASANLTGVSSSSAAWGDYDNDGDLDILLTGEDSSNNYALVYENRAGVFVTDTVASQNLTGVHFSSAAWGDYDNDGDLDILLTGMRGGSNYAATVYQNTGSGFAVDVAASANLIGVYRSSVAWGDYDGDNDLDILLTGRSNGPSYNALVYRNDDCVTDLTVTKWADPEPAVAGMPLTYTILITNQGSLTATNVTISDTLSPSTTLQYLDQTDGSKAEFDEGVYSNTHWYDSRPGYHYNDEWLEIENTLLAKGVYTSHVFDASNVVSWTTLAWRPRRPAWKPLPDNGAAEEDYVYGEADMGGNRLLLHLDSLAGSTITDTSGFANHGACPATISETCPTASADGRFNGALSFDGTLSQTVVVTDAHDPIRYALETWVYVPAAGVTDTAFILRTDTPTDTALNYSHLLGILDGRFQHTLYDGAYHTITSTTPVTPDMWHHVVGTAESDGDMKLYVDGEQEGVLDGVGALWAGGDWYRLGSTYGPTGTARYYSGRLDEVAVYSRTLSSGEVLDHYLRGALRLSFSVRSCDDAACVGESWSGDYSEQTNSSTGLPTVTFSPALVNNRYFQYQATFETDDADYSPQLRWVDVEPDHRAVYASQGSCDADPHAFTCDLGDLAGGGTISIAAHVNVDSAMLGLITNTVTVSATNDITSSNNSAFVTSTVVSEVDINIQKYDDDDPDHDGYDTWDHGMADPVNPGFPMTYTLQVHNAGPSDAWDVWISDTLPITVTGVSAHGNWDPQCEFTQHTVSCTVAHMDDYVWRHLIVTGTAPTAEGWITNTAWITAEASSVYTTSHISDTQETLITPLADLSIVKTAHPDPVDPGETLTFFITVTNEGPSLAAPVVVTDTLQAGLTAHAIGGNWICNEAGNVVDCSLTDLANGASDSFQITTTAPLSGFVGNVATAASDTYDPDYDNNTAYAYASVLPVANLHISKTDTLDPVNAGAPLTYTLTVSNSGYVPAGAYTSTLIFANQQHIDIPWAGRAHRYPSNLHVGGVAGVVGNLQVRLHDLSHEYPADISVLLVGPDGQNVVLMSNAGGGADVDATLTFDDAGQSMPLSDTLTSTVTYRPTNYGLSRDFHPPAPDGPYGGSLSAFDGSDPNGLWRLYVMDTMEGIGGEIAGGWSLHFIATTQDVVTMTDALPAGLTGAGVTHPYGWVCGSVAYTQTCTTSYLGVNAPEIFTITATAPITGGVITNTAWITSTTADFWPDSNEDAITTTILAVADLAITKTVEPLDTVGPGAPLTYTLTISNGGPSPVQTAVVTDALPDGLTGVSAAGCDIGQPQGSASTPVTCTISSLAADATTDVVITANAPITPSVITNTASVTATVSDPDLLNNTDFVTVTVAERADLAIVKTIQPDLVVSDALVTYTLHITNIGPSEVQAVTVTDVISGASGVGAPAGTDWNCNQVSNAFTCTTISLTVGAAHSIVFTATAPATGGIITNTAVITGAAPLDPDPLNNTCILTTLVRFPPTITVPFDDYVTNEDMAKVITFTVSDPDTPLGSLNLVEDIANTALIQSVTFGGSGVNRTVTVTPAANLYGASRITITVTDDDGLSDSDPFTLTVTPVNDAPWFTSTPVEDATVGEAYTYDIVADDVDIGDVLTITATTAPAWLSLTRTSTRTASLSGTPSEADLGDHLVELLVRDTGGLTDTQPFTITVVRGMYYIHLPLVQKNYAVAPDLVVDSLVATGDAVTVTISNQGAAPVTRTFENEFWVDVYIDPDPVPTRVNQTWAHLGSQGLLWGVTQDALPLDPGETLVLTTSRDSDGAYFWPQESVITWTLPAGTEVWAQVDSAHEETDHGAVLENHEIIGAPYAEGGNILGPALSTAGSAATSSPSAVDKRQWRPPLEHHLPPRP